MRFVLVIFLIFFASMKNMSGYQQLCTEFYDLTKPEAGEQEIKFYETFLKTVPGPYLEAMCGSGRLLIPLLRRGYQIDGLDNSSHMLESCSQRCKFENLNVNLFNQSLQNLSLPHKYGLIFIALGSFQLIENRSEALIILKRLYDHLIPGGVLLIETFVPWDAIKDSIEDGILKDKSTISFEKKISSPKGYEIIHQGQTTVYAKEQLEISESKYEKNVHGKKVSFEKERLVVRWYYRHEMELLLEKAGFSKIKTVDESFELNPQATIYQAIK